MKKRKVSRVLVLALLMGACIGGKKARARGAGPVMVEVRNNNWADVVVYAISGSQTVRIGDVTTGRTARFRVPAGIDPTVRDFRIRIDPIGPRTNFLSQFISVGPGQTVFVTVENDLTLTSYVVR